MFTNPVPVMRLRKDSGGNGEFMASRDGGSRLHDGIDVLVTPGEPVYAPCDGKWQTSYPYAGSTMWRGVKMFVESDNGFMLQIDFWYIDSRRLKVMPEPMEKGAVIGYAQNISLKYGGGMKPHMHIRVRAPRMSYLVNGAPAMGDVSLNPRLFWEVS